MVKPAIYELKENESLNDLIDISGGLFQQLILSFVR